jgi:hypothetical protein
VHDRERQLAGARAELDVERRTLEARSRELETLAGAAERDEPEDDSAGRAGATAALAAAEARERTLAGRESKLEASERELALVRQGLDAERKALVERERLLRRREVTEARESLTQPFATPSFSEGLAALARARSRD